MRSLLRGKRAAIMGVVNVTPDSFSDGGSYFSTQSAIEHGLDLIEQGADILDVGGESTRPGAAPVDLPTELARVIPVIEGIRAESNIPISIDTYKSTVMTASVAAGATMINDINALQAEGAVAAAVEAGVPVCLMHKQGLPSTMQQSPQYANVVADVLEFLLERRTECVVAGIAPNDIVLDPGIGFGKTLTHNLTLLSAIPRLKAESHSEWLIGVSRKSMIDNLLQREVSERLPASLGLAVQAALNGARILRVHDVRATYDALHCVAAVLYQAERNDNQ
ncbi:dihydropteroate synthase [Arenicella xantha]|nr:dihydropteroate synthase [Arenicella xantha]